MMEMWPSRISFSTIYSFIHQVLFYRRITKRVKRSGKGRERGRDGENRRRKKEGKKQLPAVNRPGGEETLNQVTDELSEAPLMVRPVGGKSTRDTGSHTQTAEPSDVSRGTAGGLSHRVY